MDTPDDTDAASAGPAVDASGPRPPTRPGLDGRTIAICVCAALAAAILAGLLASIFVDGTGADDDPGSPDEATDLPLQQVDEIDTEALFATALVTIDGKPTDLAAYRNDQPMLVNIWQWNCAPCIDEMPLLERAHEDHPDLRIIGIHSEDDLAKAKELAAKTAITYPWVQDPKKDFMYAAKVAGMPTSFLVEPSGRIVATKSGAFTSQSELQRWLDDHLA